MVDLVESSPTGFDYLALVTGLLQACRCADPVASEWEAADFQWWWRKDQHADPGGQRFWLRDGTPVAAAILTDWGTRLGFEVIGGRALGGSTVHAAAEEEAWSRGVEMFARDPHAIYETTVREGDEMGHRFATAAGFDAGRLRHITLWMDAAERRPAAALPSGFSISDRSENPGPGQPHPMIGRNGPEVEARLRECSLYRPDLDLAVRGPDGEVAGYALFWADPVTGVGLVEPMRTEDAFQGRGFGRGLLAEGLSRLASAGCRRLKVSHVDGNETARRLYEGAGFRPASAARTFVRQVRPPTQ
jgi:GNAT superfamily N-acetyltransferase